MMRFDLNAAVAATLLCFGLAGPLLADPARLDELFARLQAETLPEWESVEQEIFNEWSKSGSDSMDLLLQRGRDALEEGDTTAAIEHFTALTDHAPEFAEGFNARATAYFHAGLYGPSLADIQRALALNPRHFGALAGLGTIMMELGREKDALKAFRAAHELNPHRSDLKEAVQNLGPKHDGVDL